MLVDLRELVPNPMRDFVVDPMDDDRINDLLKSIEEDGFWGGIVCRQVDSGLIQIAAGHTRVQAALKAGIIQADVFVGNGTIDDAAMVRIYARENATQRGNLGTAQVGSVASALRFIAKVVLMGGATQEFLGSHDPKVVHQRLTDSRGLGQDVLVYFLRKIPGINAGTVQQALANLKSSGDYARIIKEVQEEIERENAEAIKALAKAEEEQKQIEQERIVAEERQRAAEAAQKEAKARVKAAKEATEKKRAEEEAKRAELERQRAEELAKLAEKRRKEAAEEMKKFDAMRQTQAAAQKAVDASDKKPITFDFEGVAKHLKVAHQIDVFRQCVTGEGVAPLLPVNRQAALAAKIVALSEKDDQELSGRFIREQVTTLVLHAKGEAREATKQERERLQRNDLVRQANELERGFVSAIKTAETYGLKIVELLKKWPKDLVFPVSTDFKTAMAGAKKIVNTLNERI